MRLLVTRDSVAAGDDADAPHLEEMHLPDGADARQVVALILENRYLPQIGGGEATWTVVSNKPLAVAAQQWEEPRMLAWIPEGLEALKRDGDAIRVHVSYHAQQDPDVVFEVLGRLSDGF